LQTIVPSGQVVGVQPVMLHVAGVVHLSAQREPPLHCTVHALTPLHWYSQREPPPHVSAVVVAELIVTRHVEPPSQSVVHCAVPLQPR